MRYKITEIYTEVHEHFLNECVLFTTLILPNYWMHDYVFIIIVLLKHQSFVCHMIAGNKDHLECINKLEGFLTFMLS